MARTIIQDRRSQMPGIWKLENGTKLRRIQMTSFLCMIALECLSICMPGQPAAAAIEVGSFACDDSDESLWDICITAERKIVEWLVMNGINVSSPLTAYRPGSALSERIDGRVHRRGADAHIEIAYRRNGSVISRASMTIPDSMVRAVRNCIAEALLYSLECRSAPFPDLNDRRMMTRSAYAYALYKCALRKKCAGRTQDAAGLLLRSLDAEKRFNDAARELAAIYREQGNAIEAERWRKRAGIAKRHTAQSSPDDCPRQLDPYPMLMESSRKAGPVVIDDGLSFKKISIDTLALDVAVFYVRPHGYAISLCMQQDSCGGRIRDFAASCGAGLAVNGGFFNVGRGYSLHPAGLVVKDGTVLSPLHPKGGSGIFYIRKGAPGIEWTGKFSDPHLYETALQCGPLLVEPGGRPGIYSNDFVRLNRAAIGIAGDDIVIAMVTGGNGKGLSLYEFAAFLHASPQEGGCGCGAAMNLDGGLSAQLFASYGDMEIHSRGLWAINNAIVVRKRE